MAVSDRKFEYAQKKIEEIWYSDEPEILSGFCRNIHFDSIDEYGKKIMKIYETH